MWRILLNTKNSANHYRFVLFWVLKKPRVRVLLSKNKGTHSMFELFQCTACLAAFTRSKFVQVSVRIKTQSGKTAIIPRSLRPSTRFSSVSRCLLTPRGRVLEPSRVVKERKEELLQFRRSVCWLKCSKSHNPWRRPPPCVPMAST